MYLTEIYDVEGKNSSYKNEFNNWCKNNRYKLERQQMQNINLRVYKNQTKMKDGFGFTEPQ